MSTHSNLLTATFLAVVSLFPALAAAQSIGDVFHCGSVGAVVGKVETFEDHLGANAPQETKDTIIVHLQLFSLNSDQPPVGHSPFDSVVLDQCEPSETFVDLDREYFESGYEMWREALLGEGAGIWSEPVDRAYEIIMEVMSE